MVKMSSMIYDRAIIQDKTTGTTIVLLLPFTTLLMYTNVTYSTILIILSVVLLMYANVSYKLILP
jgi:hypothetical protein